MASVIPRDELEAAVRAMLADETGRVRGAEPVLAESDGWRAATDPAGRLHRTEWSAERWRWFELTDLSVVDEMVVVAFRWLDPATPELTYVAVAFADRLPSADSGAVVVRQQLRRLLEPGWKDRVERTWLANRRVLIRRPGNERHADHAAELRALIWNGSREEDERPDGA